VDDHLDDLHPVRFLDGDFLEDGTEHVHAGRAPFGPEIDEHGSRVAADLSLERRVGSRHWLGHVRLLAHVRAEPLQDLGLRHRADDLVDRLPILVDDHRRDIEDPKLRGVLLVLVDIDLDDLDLVGLFGRDLLEHRPDDATGSAPRRPEIDDHGLARFIDFALIRGVSRVYWLGHGYLHGTNMRLNTSLMIPW